MSRAADEAAASICAAVAHRGGRAQFIGGCVRDALLGRAATDLDIEVFGLEPQVLRVELERIGPVSLVGESFGVLKMHGLPIDVSIPRRERKAGSGHRGFIVDADPGLSPEAAAARRDFTVNAIGWDPLRRELVDPFHGETDLKRRILRHTSHQFAEDPLRVLRGMQFVARLGLTATPETVRVCANIEPEGLAPERIFEEWRKLLLTGETISAGLRFLADTGWIRYFPEFGALVGCPQDPQWHPEGDVWTHTGHVMDAFATERLDDPWEDLVVGLACLCHDLGKPATTAMIDGRWRSPGHEEAGVAPTVGFLSRLTNQGQLAQEVVPLVADHLKPDQLYLANASAAAVRRLARRVLRLDRLLRVATADRNGRPPSPRDDFPAGRWLTALARELDVLDQPPEPLVRGRDLIAIGLEPGKQFKPLLDAAYEAQLDGAFTSVEAGLEYLRPLMVGP